jgi:hypothetical protein
MERKLGQCEALGEKRVEVINFGVSGYGTAQELLTLRNRVWEYNPDLVVLEFCANDIKDNSPYFKEDPLTPFFVYRDGNLALDSSFRQSADYLVKQRWYSQAAYRVINFSRVLQVLNQVRKTFAQKVVARRGPNMADLVVVPADESLFREPDDAELAVAWRVTEDLIVMIYDEVRNRGTEFLVVTVSSPIQAYPARSVRDASVKAAGVEDLYYVDSRISALGQQRGFSVLKLGPRFTAFADKHQVFLHGFENTTLGFGHWNSAGHRLAGDLVADEICRELHSAGVTND